MEPHRGRPPYTNAARSTGVAVLAGLGTFLVATPARASDMGILGPMFFMPVNLCAALMVAPLGLSSPTRPSMAGNIFVGLVAVFVGMPASLMAYVALGYSVEGSYRDDAIVYLVSFALLVAAIAFATRSRMSRLALERYDE